MVYEKIDLSFDIEKLVQHLKETVFSYEPVMPTPEFGGWSVTSSNGSYQDGWFKGHLLLNKNFRPDLTEEQKRKLLGIESADKPKVPYKQPTEICTGYLKHVVDTVIERGFECSRARISVLKAGKATSWHTDAPPETFMARLHIPLITYPECVFETENESEHIPADGSCYLVQVNRLHRVINRSEFDRYHLIMNIIDRNEISKFHRARG